MNNDRPLYDLFLDRVKATPDGIAVHHRGQDCTYAKIAELADSLAAWLESEGLAPGDRVALLLPNSSQYVACYLGILRVGGVVVALNPDTTARELYHTLGDALPRVVITGKKAAAPLSEAACRPGTDANSIQIQNLVHLGHQPESPFPPDWSITSLETIFASAGTPTHRLPGLDDLAQLIYTSGTTGRPKGISLSHRNIAANSASIVEYLELTADDSVFVILPFFYSYGNSLLFSHLAVGGRLILASDFVFWNRALDLMMDQRATGFAGVPSSYAMLLHKSDFHKRTFSDLRYITSAGGGLAPAVVEQLRTILPHARLFPMYGQTEATARLSTLMPEEIDARPGSIGRGIPGVRLQVLGENRQPVAPGEVGEIVAQGENIMLGYWNDPIETSQVLRPEGLCTGDLARRDADGYVYIVGRKSDMIKSGAYRINPKEIEDVILELPHVAEVAVVGMPDEILGERLVAFVVPSGNGKSPTDGQIVNHCRGNLPRYKLVREIRFLDSLPKTSSGKIRRHELLHGLTQELDSLAKKA